MSKLQHKPALLLVDDDPLILDALAMVLAEEFAVHTAESRPRARALVEGLIEPPAIALVDLGLPPKPHSPEQGFKLINELLAFNQNMKILVLSGQNERKNIRHALTVGAVDFVPKPCDVPLLKSRLSHQLMMLEAEQSRDSGETSADSLLGESPAMEKLRASIQQFADTPFPVLIEGESGSGKELVAHYLHVQSERAVAPFKTINCAAFSANLLEAQLFGHAKGAFTGASTARAGFFEESADGTLFMDEIGDMPLDLQAKLLRVLENGEYYRLGETTACHSSARIVAATNRDLREEVRRSGFREDLYHRLSVLTIAVPPLRDRDRDCFMLVDHFRRIYALKERPFTLSKTAEKLLQGYRFPGNVRELRNIVIRLSAKYPGQTVDSDQMENEIETAVPNLTPETDAAEPQALEQELTGGGFVLDKRLSGWERQYVSAALRMSGGNLSKAARLLGINRTTLYSRMQKLGVRSDE